MLIYARNATCNQYLLSCLQDEGHILICHATEDGSIVDLFTATEGISFALLACKEMQLNRPNKWVCIFPNGATINEEWELNTALFNAKANGFL